MPESQLAKPSASGAASARPSPPSGVPEPGIAALVDATGILVPASADDVLRRMTGGQFFWLDIFTADATARGNLVAKLRLDEADRTWILHFGQAPRMAIAPSGARVVTMAIGPKDQLLEVHVLWTGAWIVTVWAGEAASLQEVRQRFATGLHETHQTACISAMVLLLLLLSTIDDSVTRARAQLYTLEEALDGLTTADLNLLRSLRRRVQRAAVHVCHYYAAARSAAVSVDLTPGMAAEGVSLVKEYADHVEDLAHQLESVAELIRAVDSEIPAILARKQSRRLNQLTAISAVFLPITFLTGFFGMNFQWMIDALGSREAFLVLAVALPIAMITVTVVLLAREGFIGRRPSN